MSPKKSGVAARPAGPVANSKKLGIDVAPFALRASDDALVVTREGALRGVVVAAGGSTLAIRVVKEDRTIVQTIRLVDVFKARRFA